MHMFTCKLTCTKILISNFWHENAHTMHMFTCTLTCTKILFQISTQQFTCSYVSSLVQKFFSRFHTDDFHWILDAVHIRGTFVWLCVFNSMRMHGVCPAHNDVCMCMFLCVCVCYSLLLHIMMRVCVCFCMCLMHLHVCRCFMTYNHISHACKCVHVIVSEPAYVCVDACMGTQQQKETSRTLTHT
jgi:hypothetical protein